MGRYARKRAKRLVILAGTNPAQFKKLWDRRLQSKLNQIHKIAGDLSVPIGAFEVADQEVNLLRRRIPDKQEIRNTSTVLENEAIRALRLNGC
jgi:hypothetical protein